MSRWTDLTEFEYYTYLIHVEYALICIEIPPGFP